MFVIHSSQVLSLQFDRTSTGKFEQIMSYIVAIANSDLFRIFQTHQQFPVQE